MFRMPNVKVLKEFVVLTCDKSHDLYKRTKWKKELEQKKLINKRYKRITKTNKK